MLQSSPGYATRTLEIQPIKITSYPPSLPVSATVLISCHVSDKLRLYYLMYVVYTQFSRNPAIASNFASQRFSSSLIPRLSHLMRSRTSRTTRLVSCPHLLPLKPIPTLHSIPAPTPCPYRGIASMHYNTVRQAPSYPYCVTSLTLVLIVGFAVDALEEKTKTTIQLCYSLVLRFILECSQ